MLTALTAVALLVASPAPAQQQGNVTVASPECSSAIANPNCVVAINPASPSSPLPIKLKKTATLTITVKKRPLDMVGFETASKDVVSPAPTAAIFTALLPGLSAFMRGSETSVDTAAKTLMEENRGFLRALGERRADPLTQRLKWIADRQDDAAQGVTSLEQALKKVEGPLKAFQKFEAGDCPEEEFSAAKLRFGSVLQTAVTHPSPAGLVQALKVTIAEAHKAFAATPPSIATIEEVTRLLNIVAARQADLETDVAALTATVMTLESVLKMVTAPEFTVARATAPSHEVKPSPSGRPRSTEVTVTLTDSLTGKKSTLGTVTAVWATSRWETSAGPLFSDLRIRSFAGTPKWVNGVAARTADDKAVDSFLAETESRPMVVPFALVHWNAHELATDSSRVAILLTGGLGVNPHTKTADYALGLSFSHRSLYLSLLAHRAQDLKLTGGLTRGQSLGSPAPAITTQRFWSWSPALSLTIRVF